MTVLTLLVFLGGILHFCILPAGVLVPIVLDFRTELKRVSPMLRHLVWVYASFIFLTIVGFGAVSVVFAEDLTGGTLLARAVCGFIGGFWFIRLLVQLFLFDVRPYLTNWYLKLGYHGLTVVFICQIAIYILAATLVTAA